MDLQTMALLVAKIVETPSFFSPVTTVAANLSTYLMSFSYCSVAIHSLFVYKHCGQYTEVGSCR